MSAGVDAEDLVTSRWAIMVNGLEDAALLRAVWPLVELRMGQMGLTPPAVSWREGESCGAWWGRHSEAGTQTLTTHWGLVPPVMIYRPGERVGAWLARHGVVEGNHVPARVPLYLTLLGRPGPLEESDEACIPFEFQYDLGVTYRVGRLCFADDAGRHEPAGYEEYVAALCSYERSTDPPRRHLAAFAPLPELDRASQLFMERFVRPLIVGQGSEPSAVARLQYNQTLLLEQEATRANLDRLLGEATPGGLPSVLLVSSYHTSPDPHRGHLLTQTGAIITQDWSGIGPTKREHWFAAEDLRADVSLAGLAVVQIGAYSVGVPEFSGFTRANQEAERLAPFAFISRLPQAMLRRGAIGVIGHVDNLWTYSVGSYRGQPLVASALVQMVTAVLAGERLGRCLDPLSQVYSARAALLLAALDRANFGGWVEPGELERLSNAVADARNYILIGDPAARLRPA